MNRYLLEKLRKGICIAFIMGAMMTVYITLLTRLDAYAAEEIGRNIIVYIDGDQGHDVKAIDVAYDHNEYVSLRDMAASLKGTQKEFSLSIDSEWVDITKGGVYSILPTDNQKWTEEGISRLAKSYFTNTMIRVDGEEVRYYINYDSSANGINEPYIMLVDLCMLLDMDISVTPEGVIRISTTDKFNADIQSLEFAGYLQGVNSVLVGDASTGTIFYEYRGSEAFPIASTTKLMTSAIVFDYLSEGKIKMTDSVPISAKVEKLSNEVDGVIKMTAGKTATLEDLLYGALLPSSNESALCLAEYVAGDEASFVEKMTEKAKSLGMETAIFYNCNGLPFFGKAIVPVKKHNRMSSEDMFKLCSYIINNHQDMLDITSTKVTRLSSFGGKEVKNTNGVLYNLPGTTGLKTGTTNKAGACLVTSYNMKVDGENHDIVAVLFGAESSQDRIRVSELLLRYGIDVLNGDAPSYVGTVESSSKELPTSAEGIIECVLSGVRG